MKWLLAKVRYERPADDGSCKKVTEQYVVDAMSFAEAETRITQYLQPYVKGEFEVTGINPKNYAEVHFSDFGDYKPKEYKAKAVRNIKQGTTFTMPAKTKPVFKASPYFCKEVAGE